MDRRRCCSPQPSRRASGFAPRARAVSSRLQGSVRRRLRRGRSRCAPRSNGRLSPVAESALDLIETLDKRRRRWRLRPPSRRRRRPCRRSAAGVRQRHRVAAGRAGGGDGHAGAGDVMHEWKTGRRRRLPMHLVSSFGSAVLPSRSRCACVRPRIPTPCRALPMTMPTRSEPGKPGLQDRLLAPRRRHTAHTAPCQGRGAWA